MVEMSMQLLGARVREARSRRGMSQEDLGSAVGLERSVVSKVEAGTRKVTALELSDIASALGTRMSEFFNEPNAAVVLHRSSQGLDTADSNIDSLLAQLARDVEFVAQLNASKLNEGVNDRRQEFRIERPSSHSEAESSAAKIRELLPMADHEPLLELGAQVSKAGLLAFSFDIGVDTADAGYLPYTLGGIAVVNSHMKVGRRRLALAHELGHHLMNDSYTVDWRVSEREEESASLESRLDRFARALLLPEAALSKEWPALTAKYDVRSAAIIIASRFRVDFSTLSLRLRETDLASQPDVTVVRQCTPRASDFAELDLHAPPEELSGTSVPRAFTKAVVELVRNERISRERALDLLQGTFEDADLPEYRTRRADEIWNFVT